MLPWAEKMKLKALISEAVREVCKDGLMPQLKEDFCVEGLIGVTLGRDELLMVSINERLCDEVTKSSQTPEGPSASSPPSGHSTKRKITHAPDWSEDVQTATEDANNTKKARYLDSVSENVTSEQIQDQDNSEEIQVQMEESIVHLKEAGYSETSGELIPDKQFPDDLTGSLLMSAEECETDFVFSPQTHSSSATNSATCVKTLPPSPAVYSNSGKDIDVVKTLSPTERSKDIDEVQMLLPTERSKDIDEVQTLPQTERSKDIDEVQTLPLTERSKDTDAVKTPPQTERRMTRRSSARKGATGGANLEVAKRNKAVPKGKDINLSAQKKKSNFDENTRIVKLTNNCKKTRSSERTVTKSTNAIDRQKPEESACIKDIRVELQDIVAISSVSPQKHFANDETTTSSSNDDSSDDAFDDVDDELSSDTDGIVAPVDTDSLADQSNSLTSVIQNQSGTIDTSSASPDRNQSNFISVCGDSALQFNIKSEPVNEAEGAANPIQITDVRQMAVVIVKPEPQDDNLETESQEPVDYNLYRDLKLSNDDLETELQDDNAEPESEDGHMEPEPQMDTRQLSINRTVHQFGVVTNSLEHDKPVYQINPFTKPACQKDKDNEALQIDKDVDEDTQAVHQIDTTQQSLQQKGQANSSKHGTKYLCQECGKSFKNSYFYNKHLKNHSAGGSLRQNGEANSSKHGTKYLCQQCGKSFKNSYFYNKHLKNHSAGGSLRQNGEATSSKHGTKYLCQQCGKSFKNSYFYNKHMKNHGAVGLECTRCNLPYIVNRFHRCVVILAGKKSYRCNVCEKMFDRASVLKNHYNIVHRGIQHKCPHCKKEFGQISQVIRHIQEVHGKEPHSCLPCGKFFASKYGLTAHKKGHLRVRHQCQNGEATNSKHDTKYLCQECGKNFKNSYFYRKHIKNHGAGGLECTSCNLPYIVNRFHRCAVILAGKTAYRCNVCENIYNEASVLKNHYNIVHRGIHHKCPHCKKDFSQICQVVRHIQNVHGKAPHSCLPCGKCFTSAHGLTAHKKGHLRVRHQCPQCNREFSDIGAMKLHIRNVHAKVKTYSCESCGKYFSARNQLEVHRKIHVGKRYKCPQCKREFKQKSEVKHHIRIIHEKVKPYSCEYCGKCFSERYMLKSHQKVHT